MKKFIILSSMLGLVLPFTMFAEDTVPKLNVAIPPIVTTYNGTCASNAVIAYENSQQAIFDTKQASIKAAALTRRDALSAAYVLTDEVKRNTTIRSVYDAFLLSQKNADLIARDALKIQRGLFTTTMQGCGALLPDPTRDQMENQNYQDNNNNENNRQQMRNMPGVGGMNSDTTGTQNQYQNKFFKQGMRGEEVKRIQKILNLNADGVFGPETSRKVREWQKKEGLKEDGILGKESFYKLEPQRESNN